MVTLESSCAKHCENIEAVIAVEKRRLQTAKDQLKQYGSNPFFEKEREESKIRDDQIRWCKKQVQFLTREYDKLREEFAKEENRKIDESQFASTKRSLKVVATEIESFKFEIDKLDKKLRQIREINGNLEKDQEKKLKEFHASHGFIIKPRSSGCLQLGRLMMEQEDVKQALNLITDKRTRLQFIIRELEKSLMIVEKECFRLEENIRKKESEELERNQAMIECEYQRRKELNDQLEFRLVNARGKLQLLEMTRKQMKINQVAALRKKLEEEDKLIEKYRENLAELSMIASTLHNDLVDVTRQKSEYTENYMKNYRESMRRVNFEISKIKRENSELDEKIENLIKKNKQDNYGKQLAEEKESEETNAQRLLTKFSVEEKEAKEKLHKVEDSAKKVREQIEYLLDFLFNAQIQCFAKERFLEEISNGLWEVKTVNKMMLRKQNAVQC